MLVMQRTKPIFDRALQPKEFDMKKSLVLAFVAFLGLGAVSTAFAQDAMGGVTNSRGGYAGTSY